MGYFIPWTMVVMTLQHILLSHTKSQLWHCFSLKWYPPINMCTYLFQETCCQHLVITIYLRQKTMDLQNVLFSSLFWQRVAKEEAWIDQDVGSTPCLSNLQVVVLFGKTLQSIVRMENKKRKGCTRENL